MRQLIKNSMKRYKGFTCAAAAEILFLVCLAVMSAGKQTQIQLNAEDLILYDEKAAIVEYQEAAPMALDADTLVVYDNKENKGTLTSLSITGRDDSEPYGRWIAGSAPLTVRPGMYELEVKYYSLLYNNEVGGNSDNATGMIQLLSADSQNKICYNEITLCDSVTVNSTRVWVRSPGSIDDLEIKVNFYGLGDLRIDSISLKELPLWRLLKWIAWLLLFVALDLAYLYFFTENQYQNKTVTAGLLLTIVFSSLPLFADFLLKGHDMDFHVARIWALAENIKAGHWVFPLQTQMANGYGYASPLFYGQIFLYFPAILYNMGAPIQVCFQIYVLAVNAATVLISFYCFKGIIRDKQIALAGAFLYTLSAYRVANVYLRSAAGEYTAMAFYPLLLYGFARIYRKEATEITWKDCLPVVLGLSGLIQSHILSCELAAIFILLFCVICIRRTLELRRFVALALTALVTVCLNLFFLVPFLASMRGMHIRVYEQEAEAIQHYGTYLIQVLGVFMTSSGDTVDGMTYEMPLALGFSLVVGIVLFLWCCVKKYEWNLAKDARLKTGVLCVAFTVVSVVMSTKFFPWNGIEEISPALAKIFTVVQFPWRYLSIATVFAAVATIIGLRLFKEHKGAPSFRHAAAWLVGLAVLCTGLFYMEFANTASEYKVYGGADVEQDTVGGEYMLTGTIEGYMRWRSVKADLSQIGISDYQSDHGTITFTCVNVSDSMQVVQIPILNYDNYHAYLSDGTELVITNGENNRLGMEIPGGV